MDDDMCWYGTAGFTTEQQRDEVFAAFAVKAGEHLDALVASTTSQFPGVPAGLTSGVEADGLPGFWFLYRMDRAWGQTDDWIALSDLASQHAEGGGQHLGPWQE
ncbi:hypothetical protein [Micromonospora sp. NPDC004704]